MSSTTTDDQPDKPREVQSSTSLAQQHSAVSPLLDNIIGGAERFAIASKESISPDLDTPVPSHKPGPSSEVTEELQSSEASLPKPIEGLTNSAPESDSAPNSGTESLQLSQDSNPSPQEDPQDPANRQQPKPSSLIEQYGDAGLFAELNALAQTQQFQLEQHRAYLQRSQAEQDQQVENWQMRYAALEEQLQEARDRAVLLEQRHLESQSQVWPLEAQRDAAQQITEQLQTEILERRQQQARLEEQLDLAEDTLREQQEITAAQSRSIVSMQAELSKAQAEVVALETRLSHQGHLRQQLKADGSRDREERSKARDRQLQLEQETTQMTGQLLRLSEELRQAQRQSVQWRRQAQTQAEQLQEIAHWAAQAESVPPALMALLEPVLNSPDPTEEPPQPSPSPKDSKTHQAAEEHKAAETHKAVETQASASHAPTTSPLSSLDLPNFPHSNV